MGEQYTMTHDGECDMLKYICPEVEMSIRGLAQVLTFQLRDIYICMSHETIVRHLFFDITDKNLIKQYKKNILLEWNKTIITSQHNYVTSRV